MLSVFGEGGIRTGRVFGEGRVFVEAPWRTARRWREVRSPRAGDEGAPVETGLD